MLTWLFIQYLRDTRIHPPIPIQLTALTFFASLVADANVLTDWLYYRCMAHLLIDDTTMGSRPQQDVIIPERLHMFHFVTCTCGTLSYLAIVTDGKIINWIRSGILLIPIIPVLLLLSLFAQCHSMIEGVLVRSKKNHRKDCDNGAIIKSLYHIKKWA